MRLIISQQVQKALSTRTPVIALESTIITHGMPYPHNFETATRIQNQIFASGCTPATIAILNGTIHVGLNDGQLLALANSKDAIKVSKHNISQAVALNRNGSTTVAATMFISKLAGIDVFVTGGLGGVHRRFDGDPLDVSADLTELGKTDVAVVCAGVKSILDIPSTLEYLETLQVSVVTVGDETSTFPSFYYGNSKYKSQFNTTSLSDCAKMIQVNKQLRLNTGMLFAAPIPKIHEPQIPFQEFEEIINKLVLEARQSGIRASAKRDHTIFT